MTKPKTNTRINGRDYYRIRRTIDGKQHSFYGRTKAEAKAKCEAYLDRTPQDVREATSCPRHRVFSALSTDYINTALKPSEKYATATKDRYESAYHTHIRGTWIDRMRVDKIRPSDIQRFYNDLPVSKQTMATVSKYMRGFCRWLTLNGYAEDFLSAVEIPKKPDRRRHEGIVTWTDEEIEVILEHLHGHRLRFFVYVLLYTGARMSEAIALKHSDFRDGSIRIERQCYCGELKEPKYNSKRSIPMHEELAGAYREHRRWQERDMWEHGYTTEYVFTTKSGRLYDAKSIRTALRRYYDAHGMPNKSPHAYRATFCTTLCRCGVPIEVASSLMGHKSIEVTAKHYALVRADTKQDAIAMLSYTGVKKKAKSVRK